MTDTTWTSANADFAARRHGRDAGPAAILAGIWNRALVKPLHRALDAGLRAGELRDLDPGTLADIGYRQG